MLIPVGTLINVAAIIVGTGIGLLIGRKLPERVKETTVAVAGIVTLSLGFTMAATTHNILIVLVAVVLGGIVGEGARLHEGLQRLGEWLEAKAASVRGLPASAAQATSVATAFMTASLIFAVGPVAVLGSIQDGVSGDYQLLAIKSCLDLITVLTLATTLGWGVGLSALVIALWQGGISLLSFLLSQSASAFLAGKVIAAGSLALPLGGAMLDEMTAAGGILLVGTGLLLLDIKRLRVTNLLPAIFFGPALVLLLYLLNLPMAP